MLNIKGKVDNLDGLKDYIDFVEKFKQMSTSKEFQEYIKEKCIKTLEKVMNERLGGTTNDDSIEVYRNSNYIVDTPTGFEIRNNAKIPVNVSGKQNSIVNYDGGMFNLALAFEYGVGIVGMSTNNPNAWEYNVNNYNFGWKLPSEVADKYGIPRGEDFGGYRGLEIYRYTAYEINANLKKWIKEYESKGDKQ